MEPSFGKSPLRRNLSVVFGANIFIRLLAPSCLLIGMAAGESDAQKAPPANGVNRTASVSGRVTANGQPVPGVTVALISEESFQRGPASAQAETDESGRYLITGVAAGAYNVSPLTATMVVPGSEDIRPGKRVTVAAGEAIESIDFAIVRGGVITGKVTDAEGQPVIGELVSVIFHEEQLRRRRARFFHNPFTSSGFQTDDRGLYRVYGLPAGRYRLSVGDGLNTNKRGGRFGGGYYPLTFHPDATDETKASVVEVREGQEVAGVDIRLAPRAKALTIAGRVVDAESGNPVPNISLSYGPVQPDSVGMSSPNNGGATNQKGEFRLEGILPGRYALLAGYDRGGRDAGANNFYNDPTFVEVGESDVSDVEIKVRPAGSIEGFAVLEGANDKTLSARLNELMVGASITERSGLRIPRFNGGRIGPDGHFRIEGLVPGQAEIYLVQPTPELNVFTLLRIERDGVEQRGGIDVDSGEQINNLRLVVGHGTGVITGVIKGENGGPLPAGGRMGVIANRVGGDQRRGAYAQADERGRFTMQNLIPGTYEIFAERWMNSPPGAPRQPPSRSTKQIVNVADGSSVEAELTFESTPPTGERP